MNFMDTVERVKQSSFVKDPEKALRSERSWQGCQGGPLLIVLYLELTRKPVALSFLCCCGLSKGW